MDIMVSFVPVRHTGRLLAVLTLVATLLVLSLAPAASAQTEAPTAIVLDDNPAGGDPGVAGPDMAPDCETEDYGDAPDGAAGVGVGNYKTRLSDNGPRHVIVANLKLGANAPDADNGTLQNAAANADDTSNTGSADDEDGVATLPTITTATTSVPLSVSVFNKTGYSAKLACWIDFNRDGDFTDTGERAAATVSSSWTQQTINLTFSGFAAPTAGTSYLRCRLANVASEVTYPTGAANTGEVEDYQVTIATALDFGDLPDTGSGTGAGNYNTLLSDNGPRHTIQAGVFLGAAVEAEADGQPDGEALGDDAAGATPDDEDGVIFLPPFEAGKAAQIQVTASVAGCLNAWMDYNGNGVLTDSDEPIATNLAVAAGANNLNVTVPASAQVLLYSRFRFTQQCGQGGESPTGPATNGEVEDYELTMRTPTAVSLAGFSASGSQMPWGGFALLGAVLGALAVSRRHSQR